MSANTSIQTAATVAGAIYSAFQVMYSSFPGCYGFCFQTEPFLLLPAIFPLTAGIQRKLSMTFKIRATVEHSQRNIFFYNVNQPSLSLHSVLHSELEKSLDSPSLQDCSFL